MVFFSRIATRFFGLAALLAVAARLTAQAPNGRLLTLDIAARDGLGNAVEDLRAEDLRVFDAGREQKLVYFRRGQDVTVGAMPGKWCNYRYGTFPHVVVVLLDQLNSQLELRGPDWDDVRRTLAREDWESNAYLYVLLKDGALFPVRGLPHSWVASGIYTRSWLQESLPLFEDMRQEYRARPADLDLSLTKLGGEDYNETVKRIQHATETAFLELAVRLAGVPGTKGIVWIGPKKSTISNPTRQSTESTGEGHDLTPIYQVPSQAPAPGGISGTPGPLAIQKTIALAFANGERGYRVGYHVPAANWDGRYHEVRVVAKRGGVRIQTKAGYAAVRAVDIEDDQRQTVPDMIADIPFDASTIRFAVAVGEGAASVHFDLMVKAEDVLFELSDGRYACSLAVQAIQYNGDGEAEQREEPLLVQRELTAAERDEAAQNGLPIQLDAKAPKGGRFRVVVLDRVTQSFGTLTIDTRSTHP
jgi:hypothetical protein